MLLIADAFFIHRNIEDAARCFAPIENEKPRYNDYTYIDYKIFGLKNNDPMPIDLARDKGMSLYMSESKHDPEIFGFKDRFLLDLGDEIAVIGAKGVTEALPLKGELSYAKIVGDEKDAYLVLEGRLYRYNDRGFDEMMYRVDRVSDLFLDRKNLYIVMYKKLMIMDRQTQRVSFRKNCTFDMNDTQLIHIQNGWAYIWQKKDFKRISLNEGRVETLFKRIDFLHHWQNYYIVQMGRSYTLYRYPKERLAHFKVEKGLPIYFFVLNDRLYLIRAGDIFAIVDLHTEKLHFIDPVPFASFGFGVNDKGAAYIKHGEVVQLDSGLKVVRKDKIRILPESDSFAADGNCTVGFYYGRAVLNGKKVLRNQAGKPYYKRYIDTVLAMEGNRVASVGFNIFERNELGIDLFEKGRQIASYTLPLKADFLDGALLYKDTVLAAFYDKAALIRKGHIVKTIDLGGRYLDQTLKRIGESAYLSYGTHLLKIDLTSGQTDLIDSDPLTKGLRKGEQVWIERSVLAPFMLTVRFADKNVTIIDGGDIKRYYALNDCAIFQTGLDRILALCTKGAYLLRMTLKQNKIFNFKPLEGNRFVVLDGWGFRFVDLDKIVPKM